MTKVIKSKQGDWHVWIQYCFSFLEFSKLGVEKLIECNFQNKDFGEVVISPYPDTILAIIFNIKHALEIGLKQLSIDKSNKYQTGHNNLASFKFLKIQFRTTESELLDKLEKIIIKYHNNSFCGGKLSDVVFSDNENTSFKYPNKKVIVVQDLQKGIYTLNNKDLYELIEDIVEIKRLILRFHSRKRYGDRSTFII